MCDEDEEFSSPDCVLNASESERIFPTSGTILLGQCVLFCSVTSLSVTQKGDMIDFNFELSDCD